MTSKKTYLLKLTTLIGVPAIVLCIIAYTSLSGVRSVPKKPETVIKDPVAKPHKKPVEMHVSLRDSIVGYGMSLLGTKYVAGSCSEDGFDCSGFVYYVFQHFRIQVPRSSSEFKNFGKEIPIDSVRKGDILVFLSPTRNVIGHVGLVTNPKGMESDFIHASSGGEMKVIISSLKQEGYTRRFVKAVNVL